MERPLLLILCTGNSCRSQIAEGFLKELADDLLTAQSAGMNPAGQVHPLAVKVMEEIGIDISQNYCKHLNKFLDKKSIPSLQCVIMLIKVVLPYLRLSNGITSAFLTQQKQQELKQKSCKYFAGFVMILAS